MERPVVTDVKSPDMAKWIGGAACLSENPDLFDRGDTSAERGQTVILREEAKKICGQCAVQVACLEWAMSSGEPHGIWGGLTTRERSELKHK